MNLVYCINNNPEYIEMMLASMASFEQYNQDINFYIIVNSDKELNLPKNNITQILCPLKETFRERLYSKECIEDRLNNTSYLKLWIPELLQNKLDKYLFIDCDILGFGNIKNECDTNYKTKLALCPINITSSRKLELRLKLTDTYYSTGLMLFNFTEDWTNWRLNMFKHINEIFCSFWCHEETLINYNERNISELPKSMQGYDFSVKPFNINYYLQLQHKLIHFGGKDKTNFTIAYNFLKEHDLSRINK